MVASSNFRAGVLGACLLALVAIVGSDIEPAYSQVLDGSTARTHAEPVARQFGGATTWPLQREAMAQGQQPDRLFITCSDSRLVPSLMTRTGIGELFVIRNAGNIVPPYDGRAEGVTATIEYAVAVLDVPTIVVSGHTRCGAMKAALDPVGLDVIPNVRNWLKFVEPARLAVDELYPNLDSDARWFHLVRQNVLQQITNLKTHPWVAGRTASGRLQLEGWVYRLSDRQVLRLPLP